MEHPQETSQGWQDKAASARSAEAERTLGRTEPPVFMFQPLRMRVLEHLRSENGLVPKVLTVVAPVGYGKTVLMSMLLAELRRTGRQCFWFALDDRDSSVESVISALESLLNGQPAELHPTQALFRGQPSVQSRIHALMDLLKRYPLPLTLFLDNLNCCTDAALEWLLTQLVFHTPASRQLVLSSTREIPFDLAHAQLQGLVRQIGPADLGFGSEDVARLLGSQIAGLIGQQGVQDIARQTEGWPAAVRMVQIILSNAEHPRLALKDFSGSDEGLARLLNRRVLSAFPDEVRDFLLCIAPLRTFNLELCRHAVNDDAAKQHLAYLLDRNVFVIPMDRNRSWYRLHGLFREYLLHEAETTLSAARRQTVLTRAAHWCEKNGYWRESVEYALASGSADTAGHILEQLGPSCIRNSGLVPQYIQWMEALHAMDHQAGPQAEYWFVWALAFHRRYDYARRQSAALVLRLQQPSEAPQASEDKARLQRKIAILQASIASLSDYLQEAHLGAAAWLAQVESGVDDPFNLAAANCIECGHFSRAFRFVEARQSVQRAREAAYQVNSPYVDGWVSAYAALILIYEGHFAAAYADLVAALASTKAALGEDSGIGGTLAMVAAKCAAEMGLQEEAWLLFELGSKTSRTHGFLESAACGLEAAVLLWQGQGDERISLVQLRDIAAAYSPRLSLMLSCFLIRRMLVLGWPDEAHAEVEHIGLEGGGVFIYQRAPQDPPIPQLDALLEDTRLALLLAGGKYKQAEPLIEQEMRQAKAVHCTLRLVELSLASATLAVRNKQAGLAVRHITQAIRNASPHGIVRPFQEQAETMSAVVADTKVNAWGFASSEERQFFVDRCRDLRFANQSLYDKVASLHAEDPHLATQLTARERELLGYIDVGLSNQQIADHIDVSLTTVKWHLQNLYAKLGVKNRSAALAKSRVLNVLS
jgi:LuxR family transcriptional regulator, maltose regulon positive regulatory protein